MPPCRADQRIGGRGALFMLAHLLSRNAFSSASRHCLLASLLQFLTIVTTFASAAEAAGSHGPAICGPPDIQAVSLIEAHGDAQDIVSEKLVEATFTMLKARMACDEGRVSEAITLYAKILSLGPAADVFDKARWPYADQDYHDALFAYLRHDYAKALPIAKWLADKVRYPPAQALLGEMYLFGLGVPRDHNEALRWLSRAGNRGEGRAEFFLGVMYAKGIGVSKDEVEGARWLKRSAGRGDARAKKALSDISVGNEIALED